MSSDIFLYHALWHILEIDTALVRIMRERRQCHVSSDSSLKFTCFTFFYNTDHAREKTMSCELRHLLERCYALPIDIVTEYMINSNIKITYIIYDKLSSQVKSSHWQQVFSWKQYIWRRIIFTIITKLFARPVDKNQSQGVTDLFKFKVAYNEASEGLEQTF